MTQREHKYSFKIDILGKPRVGPTRPRYTLIYKVIFIRKCNQEEEAEVIED